jgi:hypothetical protein
MFRGELHDQTERIFGYESKFRFFKTPRPLLRRWYIKKGARVSFAGRFYNLSKNRSSGGTVSESPFRFLV